jgi:uncharacterized repeat protein (TIGR01451 family)
VSCRSLRLALVFGVALGLVLPGSALAIGTSANSAISNTAQATFVDPDGVPQTVNSNTVTLRVDEVLDVTVVSNDAGDVSVFSPDDDDPLSFTVTNPGNGSEAYALSANPALSGDNYDPTDTRIYLDDGDGIFELGQDTLHSSGVNDPVLAPDAALVVFVSNDTPAGLSTGNTGSVRLTATAVTGSGLAGTVFAGQGTGGVDAVVGATTATANEDGTYAVSQMQATLVKSQSVAGPAVPGAVITYTVTMTVLGTGTITGAQIDDVIPANTTYRPGTIRLDGGPFLTDAPDADPAQFNGSQISVSLGSVTAPDTHSVEFQVEID